MNKKLIKNYWLRLTAWSLLFVVVGYLLGGLSYYDCSQCIEPYKTNHQVKGFLLNLPTIRKTEVVKFEVENGKLKINIENYN